VLYPQGTRKPRRYRGFLLWAGEESNLRPTDYESAALTAELPAREGNLAPLADLDGRRMVGEILLGFILGPVGEPPESRSTRDGRRKLSSRMLDLRRLRLLSELARRGTIAETARTVGYTPSAVSQSLSRLEEEVGVALLERDGRRVRLTPAAQALVARADRALAELDAAAAELAAEAGTVRGPVAIGAFPSAAVALVIPSVAEAARRHPELACAVHEHEPDQAIRQLRAGELDLVVSERNDDIAPPPAGGLEAHALLSEALLLVLPGTPGDPSPHPLDLTDFREADWVTGLPGSQYASALERAAAAAGFAARVAHRADEAFVVQTLVAAGLGVALLPALACTPVPGVHYAAARPAPPSRHIVALVRRGAARRPALAALLALLRHQAELVATTVPPAAGTSQGNIPPAGDGRRT
jgi:DNA-binding transcriptional LysR family regulator